MGHLDPIAYTANAEHLCPGCAFPAFGQDENGFVPTDAVDGEGNPIGAVAPWDEWYDIGEGNQTLACGSCGGVITTYEENDEEHA